MRPNRMAGVSILAATLTFVGACSPTPLTANPGGQSGGGGGQTQQAGGGGSSAEASGKWTEPCSLLTEEEITEQIGQAAAGTATGDPQHGAACEWRNDETYESVSVNIGSPDTAINDVVPDDPSGAYTFEDGPDGIRFTNAGTAMFVMDKRLCEIQVTPLHNADNAHDVYTDLVGKIRSRF